MTDHNTKAAMSGALIVIVFYTLQQFAIELGAGHVPIPSVYQWTVPIATALITGVLATLTPTMRLDSAVPRASGAPGGEVHPAHQARAASDDGCLV